jgi:hypothetical protein
MKCNFDSRNICLLQLLQMSNVCIKGVWGLVDVSSISFETSLTPVIKIVTASIQLILSRVGACCVIYKTSFGLDDSIY